MNSTDRWLRTGAALAVVGGIVALVAVYIPAFVIKGPGVDTTEKLFRDWEGKVGLVSGAIMVLGGLALWVTDERTQRKLIAALVGLASLVAIGSAAYAMSVFRSKALDSLAEAFAAQQRVPAAAVRPVLVLAVNRGALQLNGKLGVPLLIVGAGIAFFGTVAVFMSQRRRAAPVVPATSPAAG